MFRKESLIYTFRLSPAQFFSLDHAQSGETNHLPLESDEKYLSLCLYLNFCEIFKKRNQ